MSRISPALGINYGHHIVAATYDSSVTTADLNTIWSLGFRKLRVAYTTFNPSATLLAALTDVVTKALAKGFVVQWGFTASSGSPVTATVWGTYKTYVSGTFAPLAQSLGLTQISMGNEEELHADGTTLTTATVRSDVCALATTVKGGGFTGRVTYNSDLSSNNILNWAATGLGDLDSIHFNLYNTTDTFRKNCMLIKSNFPGNEGGVSEFNSPGNGYLGTDGGYDCFSNEYSLYLDTIMRLQAIKDSNIPSAYFFTWRDGSFGLPTNVWGLELKAGGTRRALAALIGDLTQTS